jgi:hypothetical protein
MPTKPAAVAVRSVKGIFNGDFILDPVRFLMKGLVRHSRLTCQF